MNEAKIPRRIQCAVAIFLGLYVLIPAVCFGFFYKAFEIDLELGWVLRAFEQASQILVAGQ